jgi:hypothetical protein
MSEARAADKRTQFERTEAMTDAITISIPEHNYLAVQHVTRMEPYAVALGYMGYDAILPAAQKIKDGVSLAVIRAHADIEVVDRDNENAFNACLDAIQAAEDAFEARHTITVGIIRSTVRQLS